LFYDVGDTGFWIWIDALERVMASNKSNKSSSTGMTRRVGRVGVGAAGMALLVLMIGGCVSYTNVPVPESAPAFKSMNHAQPISVVTRALEAVITEHPSQDAQGGYAINLPVGTTPESAQKIIDRLPEGAMVPFKGMSSDIPVYHIGRVWIRASDAKVDVVYPFTGNDGISKDQSVTIWLNGGVRKWRVNRRQYWASGTIPTPELYIPITDMDDEGVIDAEDQIETDSPQDEPVEQTPEESVPDTSGDGYQQVPTDE
jgi:hypothetical protein